MKRVLPLAIAALALAGCSTTAAPAEPAPSYACGDANTLGACGRIITNFYLELDLATAAPADVRGINRAVSDWIAECEVDPNALVGGTAECKAVVVSFSEHALAIDPTLDS